MKLKYNKHKQSPLAYVAILLCPFTMEYKLNNPKNYLLSIFKRLKVALYFCPKMYFCAKRASKIIVPPKEMQLSVSIGTFLTLHDVTFRKLKYDLIYSIVQKQTKIEQNNPMETTAYTEPFIAFLYMYSLDHFFPVSVYFLQCIQCLNYIIFNGL